MVALMPDDPRILPFLKPLTLKPGLTIRANVTVERSWTPVPTPGNKGKAQGPESTENPLDGTLHKAEPRSE
jgi:hypothetical protein